MHNMLPRGLGLTNNRDTYAYSLGYLSIRTVNYGQINCELEYTVCH